MKRPQRFVIATPICDGHDVAAVAITRILRREGAEAVYLGFNKSAYQIVKAAAEEDATGIAISTYNGGHTSFLREVLKEQRTQGIANVPLFAGGGGTILEREVASLERMGVAKVYRPTIDLTDAVHDMVARVENFATRATPSDRAPGFRWLARRLTQIEWGNEGTPSDGDRESSNATHRDAPRVWGIGGRGGAGKSTVIDELVLRFLRATKSRTAVISADPTLGDRLRMLHCYSPRVYMRSVRVGPGDSIEGKLGPLVEELRRHSFELIVVESVGLGQNELGVAPLVDGSIICMTPEYGTDVQLEKEALLGQAEVVLMNKSDFPQAEARGRRVRNFLSDGQAFVMTEARRFGDPGVTELFELVAHRSGIRISANGLMPHSESTTTLRISSRGHLGGIVDAHESYYQEMQR